MAEPDEKACLTCRLNRGELPAPGGLIYQDAWWQLQHIIEPVPLLGWLVLKPLRHVEAFADLTDEEAATFGPLTRQITRAMTTVLHPAKIYLSLYAEAEGFAHLHVHLIPRSTETPVDRRGPRIFEYGRESMATGHNQVSLTKVENTVTELREALHFRGTG